MAWCSIIQFAPKKDQTLCQLVEAVHLLGFFNYSRDPVSVSVMISSLRAHDCKYRESLARLKKNENSDDLSKKTLWGTIFEKNLFNFQESIVFEKMRKNENSGFYLINYAKIRVKMTYFIASVPRQDSKL